MTRAIGYLVLERYTHGTDEALSAAIEYASLTSRHNGVHKGKTGTKVVAVNS